MLDEAMSEHSRMRRKQHTHAAVKSEADRTAVQGETVFFKNARMRGLDDEIGDIQADITDTQVSGEPGPGGERTNQRRVERFREVEHSARTRNGTGRCKRATARLHHLVSPSGMVVDVPLPNTGDRFAPW